MQVCISKYQMKRSLAEEEFPNMWQMIPNTVKIRQEFSKMDKFKIYEPAKFVPWSESNKKVFREKQKPSSKEHLCTMAEYISPQIWLVSSDPKGTESLILTNEHCADFFF